MCSRGRASSEAGGRASSRWGQPSGPGSGSAASPRRPPSTVSVVWGLSIVRGDSYVARKFESLNRLQEKEVSCASNIDLKECTGTFYTVNSIKRVFNILKWMQ